MTEQQQTTTGNQPTQNPDGTWNVSGTAGPPADEASTPPPAETTPESPADEPADLEPTEDADQINPGNLVKITTAGAYGDQTGYGVVLETLEYDDAEGETVSGARVIPLPPEVLVSVDRLERV